MRSLALRLLLVVALVAPALTFVPTTAQAAGPDPSTSAAPGATGRPAVAATGTGSGTWVPVTPVAAWGGTGTRLTPGQDRNVTLRTGREVPSDAQALVVQVQTTSAATPGTLLLGSTADPGDTAVGFDSGTGSTTTLLRTAADRAALLRADADVRVALSVVGYVADAGDAPAAGATTAVRPTRVLDSATGQGGDLPAPGSATSVPLAGIGGVPTTGATAVWIAVETHGTGTGTLRVGDGSAVAAAPVSPRWTTSLVLAPLTGDLDLVYATTGAPLDGLRATVLGWVADGTHGTTADGALVPVPARTVPVPATLLGLTRLTLTGGAVPTTVSEVAVQATVTTSTLPGELRTAQSLLTLLLVPDAAAPVPARATSTVTTVIPVARDGSAYVAVPPGARITSLSVVGYRSGEVRPSVDREDPTVSITAPAAGSTVDQAAEPVVTLAGTAADTGSGVRSVTVVAGGTDLGAATLQPAGAGGVTWTLDTTVPAGDHRLDVTATDWAGRTRTTTSTFTVTAAAEEAAVVAPEVQVLDETTPIAEVAADSIVIDGASDLRAGDVLVVDVTELTPEGLLRSVTSVQRVGSTTVVQTGPAALTDVFLQVEIHADEVTLDGTTLQVDPASGDVLASRAARAITIGHTFKLSATAKNDALSIGGSAELGLRLTIDLKIDIDWNWLRTDARLERFEATLSASASTEVTATATGDAEHSFEKELADLHLGRIGFAIGVVPVWITPGLVPTLHLDVAAAAKGSVTYKVAAELTLGLTYADGEWAPVSDFDAGADPLQSTATGTLSANAGLKLPLTIKVYDVVGPTLTADVGPRLAVSLKVSTPTDGTGTTKTTVSAEIAQVVSLKAGAKLEVLGMELAKVDFEIASRQFTIWSDSWDADEQPNGPGGSGGGTDPGEDEPPGGGTDPTDPTDPGTDPGDEDDPWVGDGRGSGFGLDDVVLQVCLPTYTDSEHSFTVTRTSDGTFRLPPAAVSLLSATDRDAWASLLLVVPDAPQGGRSATIWEHDPSGSNSRYSSRLYPVPDQGTDLWWAQVTSAQQEAISQGYDEFWLDSPYPASSATIEIQVRTHHDVEQVYCGRSEGLRIADGYPMDSGLHWDGLTNGDIQFSVEADAVPEETRSVQVVCRAVGDDQGWSTSWVTVEEAVVGYSRWTDRFGWGDSDAEAWVVVQSMSDVGRRTCEGKALGSQGEVLRTLPLVGGSFDKPWRNPMPS